MFPLWLLKALVFGGLGLCTIGVVILLTLLYLDSKDKRIW